MLEPIQLPNKVKILEEKENKAIFEITPLYPGYGVTIGNALRRVLLSSLPGAAVVSVKIKGVAHEFSTIPHVKENVVSLILNLKKLRCKVFDDKPVKLSLFAKGEKKVLAKDIEKSSAVEIVNPELLIATLTDKKASLEMELTIERGRGYVPVEMRQTVKPEVGTIAIDAIYTPVLRVSYNVENIRVGKRIDYNRLLLTVETDGTITPQEALNQATDILLDQFQLIRGREDKEKLIAEKSVPLVRKEEIVKTLSLSDLKMPSRAEKAFKKKGINTIEDLTKITIEDLKQLPGLGEKTIDEVLKILTKFNLKLKS